jgi:hypothetical protein
VASEVYRIKVIKAICSLAGFPASALDEAAAIAMAESGGKASVVNPTSHNTGLFQIGPKGTINDAGVGLSESALKNENVNASAAYKIWKRDGKTFSKSWSTYGGAAYQKYLAMAKGQKLGNPMEESVVGQVMQTTIPGTEGLASISNAVTKGGNWISNPSSWLRIGYVVGGSVLALLALQSLFKPVTSAAAGAVLKAASVVPQGKGIAKVAKVMK